MPELPENLRSLEFILNEASKLFERTPEYQLADRIIYWALAEHPKNDEEASVLIMSILINNLYRTSIYAIDRIAHHIYTNHLGEKIAKGDWTVIDDIRLGHGIKKPKKTEEDRDLYVFASKYAHFHNPSAFPIVDKYVVRVLFECNQKYVYFKKKFIKAALEEDYSSFKTIFDKFAKEVNIASLGYKKIDQGLWIYAKYLYADKNALPEQTWKEMDRIAEARR